MANEWDPDNVFEIWADDRARQILFATGQESLSVEELVARCEGSKSSVYRRVRVLTEAGLLAEQVAIDDDGHHYSVYERACDHLRITIEDGDVVVELDPTTTDPISRPSPKASGTD